MFNFNLSVKIYRSIVFCKDIKKCYPIIFCINKESFIHRIDLYGKSDSLFFISAII
ncbi:hypothetical protein BACCOP_00404 [Phocaeicola coprocola DSM 17136]|uniref:Uncharacterized protein n=1 Tax=Phocaeicola coprocola DSM 17136 TaxID=470145 RepID=B3JEW0_9BACT|nr:hypothetical protein BACCOP_00404 [Phocaeicola coprocola DSM 17136]